MNDWEHVSQQGRSGWRHTVRKTLHELEEFYLTPEHRQKLARTRGWWRWLRSSWYLLVALIQKLSPLRRVILLAALLLLWSSHQGIHFGRNFQADINWGTLGSFLLLALLLLELKDKLTARHELEAGRAVQDALMPQDCPQLAGWDMWMSTRPANDVGGDLVDALELSAGRVGVALADVAGKALPAALLMGKVQATLRALATSAPSLRNLATETNHILCRDGLPNRFATLIYLDVRENTGTVRLMNAGHMPPAHLTDSTYHELPRGNMALGLMDGAAYDEQVVELQAGEMLVVYSDGLTEALNEAGDFYGEERLQALFPTLTPLSAKEAGTRILSSVDLHRRDKALRRPVTRDPEKDVITNCCNDSALCHPCCCLCGCGFSESRGVEVLLHPAKHFFVPAFAVQRLQHPVTFIGKDQRLRGHPVSPERGKQL